MQDIALDRAGMATLPNATNVMRSHVSNVLYLQVSVLYPKVGRPGRPNVMGQGKHRFKKLNGRMLEI
jgi:hypothetical protein